ncbi:EAL domain-containing response regulator [Thalassobaculum sp.]|uniref:GGDEF/EAL domain-containing response regulator n=1 Tax=Thalassobaculum sp. TaxID=2022740 RepID=UPI0032EFE9FE
MSSRNLLVVDDEPDLGALVRDAATELDYSAVAVDSSDEFKRCYNPSIDTVVLDLALPGTDGIELIRFLADQSSRASVILMSGCDPRVMNSARGLAEAHGLRVVGAISKPVDLDVLERLLGQSTHVAPLRPQRTAEQPSEGELRDAIANKELRVHYQPKISLTSCQVTGVEALVRWQHPQRGLLSPAGFLATAVESDLIGDLTMMVLEQGLNDLRHWDRRGLAVPSLAVNFDAASLRDLSLPDQIVNALRVHGVSADRLIIEVTETKMVETVANAMEILTRLRMRGIGLSIDDFGTGHSTMSQLEAFPFSELKIDRSFINGVGRNEHTEAIVRSSIELAHSLQMAVVAEGIETFRQLEALHLMKCDAAQGYLVARPAGADDFESWLVRNPEMTFALPA